MSSTLYNRGTTTQTGIHRRAEAVERSLAELRATISTSDETNKLVRLLEARILGLERKVADLEITNTTLKATVANITAAAAASSVTETQTPTPTPAVTATE